MEIRIEKKDAGKEIKSILEKLSFSKKMITALKNDPVGITVSGEKKTVRYRLSEGDVLMLNTEEKASSDTIPLSPFPLEVLFEDEDYIAFSKPANLPIHPSLHHHDDTFAGRVMYHFRDKKFVFRCMTRLDLDTSGVVLIAKNRVASSEFSKLLMTRKVIKTYIAICEGHIDEGEKFSCTKSIKRYGNSLILREAVDSNIESETAKTDFECLKSNDDFSKLLVTPVTGRTHQIRVHLKSLGHPIVGDSLYGKESEHIKRQALHAYSLEFIHPKTKEKIKIVCDESIDIKNCEKEVFKN